MTRQTWKKICSQSARCHLFANVLFIVASHSYTIARIKPGKKRCRIQSFTDPNDSLLEVEPMIVAQQITLLQHYYLTRVRGLIILLLDFTHLPYTSVSEITASKRDADQTPGFDRSRKLHHHVCIHKLPPSFSTTSGLQISMWIVSQILCRDDADQRAQVLDFFIRVANLFLSPLQNFDGFIAIINASNDSSIHRLKKTWEKLPSRSYQMWHTLNQFTQKAARYVPSLFTPVR